MRDCDSCNLRCTAKYPGKRMPYSPDKCPDHKETGVGKRLHKSMPMLYKFNSILEGMGKEKVCWHGKGDNRV
jgi:hypothetical protein